MKLCLAFAFQNEAPWLRLHLPVWAESGAFDGIVALDGGSVDDGASVVRSMGGTVYERAFDWNFAAHMNALLTHCENLGYDAVMRMDPDELMFPEAMRAIRPALETFKALRFSRLTFEGDRAHILPFMFPDYQTRAFHLNHGVRYTGAVHETVEATMRAAGWIERGDDDPQGQRDIMRMPHLMLYHYEGLQQKDRRALKHVNYALLAEGRQAIEQFPTPLTGDGPYRYCVPFTGAQPLEPDVIGIHAPFEEGEMMRNTLDNQRYREYCEACLRPNGQMDPMPFDEWKRHSDRYWEIVNSVPQQDLVENAEWSALAIKLGIEIPEPILDEFCARASRINEGKPFDQVRNLTDEELADYAAWVRAWREANP